MEGNKYTPDALARLPREELRRMLVEELHKDTQQINDALVRLLLEELQTRGSDPAFSDGEAVEAACEKFRQDTVTVKNLRKHWYQNLIISAASIVLVLGILFFALPGAAQAGDIQGMLTWWSDSAFRFFKPGKQVNTHAYIYETDHPGLQQIYDAVTEFGITEPVVPRWVPEGFELTEMKTHLVFGFSAISAHLITKDSHLLITLVVNGDETTFQHEKDKHNFSIWDLAGREHYVLINNQEIIITWIADGIESTITTDCTEEDAYKIIKSIYTSED